MNLKKLFVTIIFLLFCSLAMAEELKIDNNNTEMYVMKAIPTGYKATHVKVYVSTSTLNGVNVYLYDHNTGIITTKGSGNTGALIDIIDITTTTSDNICIKVTTGSANILVYGADVTLAAV